MSKNNEDAKSKEVELFKRVNRLKRKAGGDEGSGPGQFDQSKINNANTVINKMASLYPKEIKNVIAALHKEWYELKRTEDQSKRDKLIERISNTSNQIKDLAGTFGYTLMEYFGDSLTGYILETALNRKEHFIIVQTHIDVMDVAFREGLKDDDGGAVGEELKTTVRKAIEKYH